MFKNSISFGPNLTNFIIFLLVLSLFSVNPIAIFCTVAFVPIAAKLLWKKGEIPLVFFAIMLQWLQISIKIIYSTIIFREYESLFSSYEKVHEAFYYSLLCLLVLCVGISISTRERPIFTFASLKDNFKDYHENKIMNIYILSIILFPILSAFAWKFGGLQQVIYKVMDLKWALFTFYFIITFQNKASIKQKFFLILLVEIILSFSGYFSSFKDFFVICILLYIYLIGNNKFSKKQYTVVIVATVILFNLLIVWQFIKPQYRTFLSGGEQTQSVAISRMDALEKAYELGAGIDKYKYQDALTTFLDRVSYIDIFSSTISYVPKSIPHENGKLWEDAVTRIFMPRFLFPNKTVINDSEKTNKYSGIFFAGADQGTSVSMGYVAESYVDFGFPLMLVPIFIFGLLIGFIYKFILSNSFNALWGISLSVPLFFQLNSFEFALDKIVGSLISSFLIYLLLNKYLIKKIDDYLH